MPGSKGGKMTDEPDWIAAYLLFFEPQFMKILFTKIWTWHFDQPTSSNFVQIFFHWKIWFEQTLPTYDLTYVWIFAVFFFGLPPLHDLSLDMIISGVWQIFRADCAVILRYCKSKLDQKCRSYLTLKHLRILNLQFPQFFKGLKRGLLTKIRCSQWLQGMVLYGTKGFQAKKSKSMTFNYKSCISYLVLAHMCYLDKVLLDLDLTICFQFSLCLERISYD